VDQIPVSTTKDIQVDTIEVSGGILDKDTGKVVWEKLYNQGSRRS
jgi:hypothetical protein